MHNPDFRPDHDSLVAKFDQLEFCHQEALKSAAIHELDTNAAVYVYLRDAIRLATLIRKDVVK